MILPRLGFRSYYLLLAALLAATMIVAMAVGALAISPGEIVTFVADITGIHHAAGIDRLSENVFFQIRVPRILLCAVVGAGLSVSGTLMQALFRNPIVEPGLIGTSSGAALGAAFVFVLGGNVLAGTPFNGALILPLFAFAGALAATMTVYRLASLHGRTAVATMLLVGIAINAVMAGGSGFLSYIARDPQARSITFWSLGTFTGADWRACIIVTVVTIPSILLALRYSKGLNALLLGEAEAGHLGIDTRRLTIRIILLNTLIVATATSMVGVIGFVGLIVPHLLRMARSSDNRFLIIGSALLGGTVMILADIAARMVIAPAELPIGIITAFVGAPIFIWMLVGSRRSGFQGGFYA